MLLKWIAISSILKSRPAHGLFSWLWSTVSGPKIKQELPKRPYVLQLNGFSQLHSRERERWNKWNALTIHQEGKNVRYAYFWVFLMHRNFNASGSILRSSAQMTKAYKVYVQCATIIELHEHNCTQFKMLNFRFFFLPLIWNSARLYNRIVTRLCHISFTICSIHVLAICSYSTRAHHLYSFRIPTEMNKKNEQKRSKQRRKKR